MIFIISSFAEINLAGRIFHKFLNICINIVQNIERVFLYIWGEWAQLIIAMFIVFREKVWCISSFMLTWEDIYLRVIYHLHHSQQISWDIDDKTVKFIISFGIIRYNVMLFSLLQLFNLFFNAKFKLAVSALS